MKLFYATASITMLALLSLAMPVMSQPPVAASTLAADGLPGGVIVMWSGQLDAIPAGWALCDGQNGTPDLSNRFVLGVGAAEYLGSTGGSHSHRHRTGNHSHQIDPPALRLRPSYGYSGYPRAGTRGRSYSLPDQNFNMGSFKSGPATAIPDPAPHLPPYYKIAFIMKL